MFDYFYKFLHFWPPNLNVNKYEQMVLMDLIKKGHPEPDKKIGEGSMLFRCGTVLCGKVGASSS